MATIKIVIKILVELLLGTSKRWFNPPPICIIPRPMDVAIPITVAIIANISIIFLNGRL